MNSKSEQNQIILLNCSPLFVFKTCNFLEEPSRLLKAVSLLRMTIEKQHKYLETKIKKVKIQNEFHLPNDIKVNHKLF